MGVPTAELGYTPAMPRSENHEVHKDMWRHWGREKEVQYSQSSIIRLGYAMAT